MNRAAGIDLGGTQIKGVVVTEEGIIERRELRATIDDGSNAFADAIRALATDLAQDLPLSLSAPGIVRADGRAIGWLPGRLQGLENLDWTEFLARPKPVAVTNDAQASLLGEAWLGAARGFRHVIMLTLGTGVGGAIIADGKLLRGTIGRAGHLGHISLDLDGPPSITGTPGALEVFCGNYNIGERTEGRFATTHELIATYRTGDADAAKYWLRSVRALACAIASFVNILDPEAVIIGGGIASAGDSLFGPLARELDRIEWRPAGHAVQILPAALGEWAGAIGAARRALLPFPISE